MDGKATNEGLLLDYWSILVRRRWVVYVAVSTVCLFTLVGSFLVTPLYRATMTLQIERQNPDILTFQDLSRVDYSWNAYSDYYETQYQVISSLPVARIAADRLGLVSHPDFAGQALNPGLFSRIKSLVPRRHTTAVDQDPLDIAAGGVLGGLEVSPVRDSQLVKLSWISPDPDLAADVANAVAASYIQFNIESQYSTTDQAQEFLVDQTAKLKNEIQEIEDRLQLYGEAKQIISIDDSSNITLQALHDIAEERTVAQTKLAQVEAAYHAVLEAPPAALPEVMNSDLISRLRQEYAAYEAEHTERSTRFGDDWPGMQVLQSKLEQAGMRLELETERIAEQVRASRQSVYEEAREEVRNLDDLLSEQEVAAQSLKRDAVEFANLQSEVDKKREALDGLIGRQNEMALSSRLKDLDSTSTNIRIMERARVPTAPFKPNTKLNLVLGLILGLGIGVAMAFLLDYVDNTVNDAAALEKLTSFPLLAMIPQSAEAGTPRGRGPRKLDPAEAFDLIAHSDSRSGVAEAYRELRTSILLSNPGHPPRKLLVSSALPGEGKTATAINLSIVLAQMGRRVALVDTDLRRPRLHKAFGVSDRRGVSTFLSGLEEDPVPLLQPTPVENLEIMASGPIPPNPSELLNSDRFADLGQRLSEAGFDHVIFDSPPVLSVSDPVIIASKVDTGILVVRAGKTPRQSIRLAAEKFGQEALGPFGVVLNSVDLSSRGSGYYRYHYYGRYGEAEPTSPTRQADSA